MQLWTGRVRYLRYGEDQVRGGVAALNEPTGGA